MIIGGHDIPSKFNTKAMIDIEELIGGDVDKLSEFVGAEGITTGTTLKRIAQIVTILANGAVFAHNKDVEFGFVQAEKKQYFTEDFFLAFLEISDIQGCMESINEEIYKGTAVVIPDNVKVSEEDEVLAEIEEIKNQ